MTTEYCCYVPLDYDEGDEEGDKKVTLMGSICFVDKLRKKGIELPPGFLK